MPVKIQCAVHTVFMTIGPTNCGKSAFCERILLPHLRAASTPEARINVQYLSTDQIRRDLLGDQSLSKYSNIMQTANQATFELLLKRLDLVMRYPIVAEFVVIDSTGLSEDFRQKVAALCQKHHYSLAGVLFRYRNVQDYYRNPGGDKQLVSKHLHRFNFEVLPRFNRRSFAQVHNISSPDFLTEGGDAAPETEVTITDLDQYRSHFLPADFEYVVIGDTHECLDELKELVARLGWRPEPQAPQRLRRVAEEAKRKSLVLIGDFLDKGNRTRDMVEFLHANREHFHLVLGNHEDFVRRCLLGQADPTRLEPAFVQTYFSSLAVLQQDEALRAKFLDIVGSARFFLRFLGDEYKPSFIATHAPCDPCYLGKLSDVARKAQLNFRYDRTKPIAPQLPSLAEDFGGTAPLHIFGHVAVPAVTKHNGRVFVDTGCVHGNKLSAMNMGTGKLSWQPFLKKQPALEEALGTVFDPEAPSDEVDLEQLSERERGVLEHVLRSKVNFISGTISPADKDSKAGELESLAMGLKYFQTKGVPRLSLQPKFMGSRCNMYLHRDGPEHCYAVTRNGNRMKLDLTPLYEAQLARLGGFMRQHDAELLILDGELMPWAALGKPLIASTFNALEAGLRSELAMLEGSGFQEQFEGLQASMAGTAFAQDKCKLSKKKLIEQYGQADYATYTTLERAAPNMRTPLSEHTRALNTFQEQLRLFGSDAPMEYKPFAVLKLVRSNGTEALPEDLGLGNVAMFDLLNPPEQPNEERQCVVELADMPEALAKARAFWEATTVGRRMEGIVLKPDATQRGVAPCMKVRNPDYLTLVYGYDYKFPERYQRLIENKSTKMKLRTSIQEYWIGQQMLRVPYASIDTENVKYRDLVAGFLFEMEKEKSIDPRL